MCPVCRCPGSPAPPQYPSGALYGSRRPRPRPPRAPPRGRCPAHSSTPRVPPQSPMPQVAPTDLYALLCNHRANLYQATASRRDEILVVLGYAWGHLTLLAGSVVVCRRSPPRRRSRRPIASFATDTHAYLSAHACLLHASLALHLSNRRCTRRLQVAEFRTAGTLRVAGKAISCDHARHLFVGGAGAVGEEAAQLLLALAARRWHLEPARDAD